MIRPSRPALLFWGALAVVNLGSGAWLAFDPDRASDLQTMQRWGHEWLVDGANIYGLEWEVPSYPPHGIVAFSPLAVVPERWIAPAWLIFNVALAVLVPYLALRAFDPAMTTAAAALPTLMFLCWGPFRTLLQFSLVTFTLGLVAMRLAGTRPALAGLSLGLALAKPHVSIPFLCWTLFTRRIRIAAIAVLVVGAGWALYCVRAQVSPVRVAQQYGGHLRTLYSGDEIVSGVSQLRPLIRLAVSDSTRVDAADAAIAAVLFGAVCLAGFAEGWPARAVTFAAPPLVALWSLLAFYHLTYGFLLLLPTAVLLLMSSDADTRRPRAVLFWALQALVVIDLPGVWRRLGPRVQSPMLDRIVPHTDRVLVLAMFAAVTMLFVRSRRAVMRGHGRQDREQHRVGGHPQRHLP